MIPKQGYRKEHLLGMCSDSQIDSPSLEVSKARLDEAWSNLEDVPAHGRGLKRISEFENHRIDRVLEFVQQTVDELTVAYA
ncbi:hypothetical protein TURU_086210 [Turdus rufiventris]|nr:hypothetical protein TURU_086210 [Turdus rufiventris]